MSDKAALSNRELQNWMQDMLVQYMPIAPEGYPTEDIIASSQRLDAVQHLSIYRQSYIARLRSCMQSQFKALSYALGEPLFEAFADQYLDSNPSTSYTLNNLGEKFASFLSETRPDAEDEEKETWPDFMIELAEFEYALSVIFDMPHIDEPGTLSQDTPDDALVLSPTLHLFEHQFPICNYYLEFNASRSPELPFPEPSYCAVSRQYYKLGLFNLNIGQYYFLQYIRQGASINAAKQQLIDNFHFDPKNLEQVWPVWRRNFVASGFFVAV